MLETLDEASFSICEETACLVSGSADIGDPEAMSEEELVVLQQNQSILDGTDCDV